jgi:hypothetical protein
VNVEFIETPTFTALIADYMEDNEYQALQSFLASDHETGDVIPETGGFGRRAGGIGVEARASVVVSG